MDYRDGSPEHLRRFLTYTETIQGRSKKTTQEYFFDLRVFLRFMKLRRGAVPADAEFDSIDIGDIDIEFLRGIKLLDIYEFMAFLSRDREKPGKAEPGIGPAARARKVASIRAFFDFLCSKAMLLDENPAARLDTPALKRGLPRYLSIDESVQLLESVDGSNAERDYLIITLFLNCGLRVSELVSINLSDIRGDTLKVTGKGDKERIVYLNGACLAALDEYLPVRSGLAPESEPALFISRLRKRISPVTVKWLIKKRLDAAGLDTEKYSAHKLRHTAATLMYQNWVDVLTLKEILGHEQLNTTQIYTHVSNAAISEAMEKNPLANISFARQEKQKD